ncbi:MAG: TerC family protein [Kofleriaceae bacterium]|nr:MAG: TerC family protein [Kofleriaceae bacterium]MBZ0238646.1 TerC family protein [Kofleriaceae bacterium]
MEWVYAGFIAFILALLVLDLGVFHRTAHVVKVREALRWSAVWISLGLAFSGFIYVGYEHHWLGMGLTRDTMSTPVVAADGTTIYNDGGSALVKYLTGFIVEKSLAVDNIFVIAMIFGFFAVPPVYQHRVLFWGILGALLMRGAMIGIGAALIARFTWILYVFGGFLILTGVKMLLMRDAEPDLNENRLIKLVRRVLPMTDQYQEGRFFVRAARTGRLLATPLFLALMLVEVTDLIFAVDSIPAIFAITTDPFLVFTSNIFAILGLRSLYFALAGIIESFKYLKVALSFVLVVIGVKMLTHSWLKAWLGDSFNFYVLGVVAAILGAGVVASLIARRTHPPAPLA